MTQRVPTSYIKKARYMEAYCQNIDMLVLGSSHAFMGINPAKLSANAYSLANVSQTLDYDYLLLEKYIDRCPNLKSVVLTISMFSLYTKLEYEDPMRVLWYKRSYGVANSDISILNQFELFANPAIVPTKLLYYVGKDQAHITEQGMCTSYTLDNKNMQFWDDGKEKAEAHTRKKVPDNEAIQYLKDIARLCEKHNVKLILVTTPAIISYTSNCDSTHLHFIQTTMSELCDEFPSTIYYNFLTDTAFTSNPDYFYDSNHMTTFGADIFTKSLSKIINQ